MKLGTFAHILLIFIAWGSIFVRWSLFSIIVFFYWWQVHLLFWEFVSIDEKRVLWDASLHLYLKGSVWPSIHYVALSVGWCLLECSVMLEELWIFTYCIWYGHYRQTCNSLDQGLPVLWWGWKNISYRLKFPIRSIYDNNFEINSRVIDAQFEKKNKDN